MKATYINCDGHVANVSDAISASIASLQAVMEKPAQIGSTDLFGDLVTKESVEACMRAALNEIGRSLMRVSESMISE